LTELAPLRLLNWVCFVIPPCYPHPPPFPSARGPVLGLFFWRRSFLPGQSTCPPVIFQICGPLFCHGRLGRPHPSSPGSPPSPPPPAISLSTPTVFSPFSPASPPRRTVATRLPRLLLKDGAFVSSFCLALTPRRSWLPPAGVACF